MTFEHPGRLALLLLAIPLVLLHLRRRRRERVVVPSLLAYDAALLGAAPPRVLGFTPRDLLLLLLGLGALGGIGVAAAGPAAGEAVTTAEGSAASPRGVAIVLDGSASTSAVSTRSAAPKGAKPPCRFDRMRDIARDLVTRYSPETPITLLLAAAEPRVLADPAAGREALRLALDGARPGVIPGGALLRTAEAAVAAGADTWVLTDGCDPDAPALAARKDLRVITVGEDVPNRAIVGVAAEWRRGEKPFVLLRVRGEDGRVEDKDHSPILSHVGDRGEWTLSAFDLDLDDFGTRVDENGRREGDGLGADDRITLSWESPRPLRVAAVAPGGMVPAFLAAGLEACGDLLDRGASAVMAPEGMANLVAAPDVVLALGPAAGSVPPRIPALLFAADEGAAEAPEVQAGDRRHPVLRGVDPAEWIVTRGGTVAAEAGDAVLLQGPSGPLAVAGTRGGVRRVILGFDPAASTLPLSASWPVFLRNALLWLGAGAGEGRIEVVRGPDGPLLDAVESDLAPRIARADPLPAAAAPAAAAPAGRPLGWGFALAAAALLAAGGAILLGRGGGGAGRREKLGAPAPPP